MTYLHHHNRSVIKVHGPDSLSFLQGVLTNDVMKLPEAKIQYNLMLTPQGRYHFDGILYYQQDDRDNSDTPSYTVYIDTDAKRADAFYKRLRLYKLRAEVTLEILDPLDVFVLTSFDETNLTQSTLIHKDHMRRDPRHPNLGYRGLYFPNPEDKQDAQQCEFSSNTSDYDLLCLKLCIPRSDIELILEKTIPLEANMEALNALCFNKGCYLGQELTTRTKHQGLVRKQLYTVNVYNEEESDDHSLTLPQKLYIEDQKVGELLSQSGEYGIAKLRKDAINGDVKMHVKNTPWFCRMPNQ